MPITPKQVKAFLLQPTDDRMGVVLSWLENSESDIDHYNIYRMGAIILSGPINPTLNIVDNDTLTVIINGGQEQTITFSSTFITSGAATPAEIIANINDQLVGAKASLSQTALQSSVLIRSNGKDTSASVEVTGGNVKALMAFPDGVFRNSKNLGAPQKIGESLAGTPTFTDLDGIETDYYFVNAESTSSLVGQNSVVARLGRVLDEVPPKVFIFGRLYDASGNPLVGAEISLRPPQASFPSLNLKYPDFNLSFSSADFGIGSRSATAFTDADGYFEIPVLADTKLRLVIPSIQYDHVVFVDNQTIEFTKLRLADTWRLSL